MGQTAQPPLRPIGIKLITAEAGVSLDSQSLSFWTPRSSKGGWLGFLILFGQSLVFYILGKKLLKNIGFCILIIKCNNYGLQQSLTARTKAVIAIFTVRLSENSATCSETYQNLIWGILVEASPVMTSQQSKTIKNEWHQNLLRGSKQYFKNPQKNKKHVFGMSKGRRPFCGKV